VKQRPLDDTHQMKERGKEGVGSKKKGGGKNIEPHGNPVKPLLRGGVRVQIQSRVIQKKNMGKRGEGGQVGEKKIQLKTRWDGQEKQTGPERTEDWGNRILGIGGKSKKRQRKQTQVEKQKPLGRRGS